jgi:hypothetical protein
MSLQNDLDGLEMRIAHEQRSVTQLESVVIDLDEKRKAAQELKAHAQEALRQPVLMNSSGNSWANAKYDLSKAEEVLAKIAHSYGPREEELRRSKVLLEHLLEQKKAFPLDQLRDERRVERLRARLT